MTPSQNIHAINESVYQVVQQNTILAFLKQILTILSMWHGHSKKLGQAKLEILIIIVQKQTYATFVMSIVKNVQINIRQLVRNAPGTIRCGTSRQEDVKDSVPWEILNLDGLASLYMNQSLMILVMMNTEYANFAMLTVFGVKKNPTSVSTVRIQLPYQTQQVNAMISLTKLVALSVLST